jgi:hypothetical protein
MEAPLELILQDDRAEKITFRVKTIVNAGRTGRDPSAVKKHLDELRGAGINVSGEIPIYHPKLRDRITCGEEIEVLPGSRTSGEVEFVLLFQGPETYVTVGSDHTDREFEKTNIRVSKQLCLNVMAPVVWRYADVLDHWDEIIMRSWIHVEGERILYQEDVLEKLLRPEKLVEDVSSRIGNDLSGTILFGGTFPIIGGQLLFGSRFWMELLDEKLGRSIKHEYSVRPVGWCN